jgi:phage head maturation protease
MADVENEEVIEEPRIYRVSAPSALIFRDEDDPQVEGPIVPYGKWSLVDSAIEGPPFMERFAAGSLTKSLTESFNKVKGYFEHGRSRMFDRTPIMEINETWDTTDAPMFRARLLNGLPEWMVDGIRKNLYGASLGASVMKVQRERRPKQSEHNPGGLEERTYTEVRVHDISLTPAPHYDTAVVLRSITDELAVGALVQNPEQLLDLIRQANNHEPQHSEPETEGKQEPETAASAESEESRRTPSRDYLTTTTEGETWLP